MFNTSEYKRELDQKQGVTCRELQEHGRQKKDHSLALSSTTSSFHASSLSLVPLVLHYSNCPSHPIQTFKGLATSCLCSRKAVGQQALPWSNPNRLCHPTQQLSCTILHPTQPPCLRGWRHLTSHQLCLSCLAAHAS